jgi:hypothetical protein
MVKFRISPVFAAFFGLFNHLLNSGEKTNNSRRNCLTALKTANIMPDGGRDFILTTLFVEPSLLLIRQTVALADMRFFETLDGAAGQEKGMADEANWNARYRVREVR